MNISIASYAFHGLLDRGMIDLFGYLETCRYRYHLHTADIWNGMLTSTEDDYLAKVKEALAERELSLENLCVDDAHIWEDDPAAREHNYQNALAHLHAGEFLGAKTIRIDAGGTGETFTNEQFDLIVTRYQEFAQRAYDTRLQGRPGESLGPRGGAGEHAAHLRSRRSSRLRHAAPLPRQHRRRAHGPLGNAHPHLLEHHHRLPRGKPDHAARYGLQGLLGRRAPLRRARVHPHRHPARTRAGGVGGVVG